MDATNNFADSFTDPLVDNEPSSYENTDDLRWLDFLTDPFSLPLSQASLENEAEHNGTGGGGARTRFFTFFFAFCSTIFAAFRAGGAMAGVCLATVEVIIAHDFGAVAA